MRQNIGQFGTLWFIMVQFGKNLEKQWQNSGKLLAKLVDIDCEYFLSDKRYQVVAWMPLPEPYKGAWR